MILVDSSVWIDYFRNESTPHTAQLDVWLDTPVEVIATADDQVRRAPDVGTDLI